MSGRNQIVPIYTNGKVVRRARLARDEEAIDKVDGASRAVQGIQVAQVRAS